MKGARIAVNHCMSIRPYEEVLIITDNKMPKGLSEALKKAVDETGAKCTIKYMEPIKENGQEPSHEIAELMKIPDVLFVVTSKSLSHTRARRDASEAGVRIASMPKVTEFSFSEGGLTTDYMIVRELIEKIHEQLKNAKRIKVTSPNGTEFTTSVENREWEEDDGLINNKGKFCNLPAGEIATAPVEGMTQGTIVFDKMGELGENIKLTVKDGYAIKIEGSLLEEAVNKVGKDARNIAEIGIGANPKSKIIGNVLEDEKVFGTIHVALGNSLSLGGKVDVPLHVDGIILKPTLEVDGRIIIKDGRWTFLDSTEHISAIRLAEEKLKTPTKSFSKIEEENIEIKRETNNDFNPYKNQTKPYNPYIIREPLEPHYFDPWVGGWTRLNNRFVINPQLYGYWIKIVEIHEKIHNIYQTGNEGFVERMTQHIFRNGYFSLSGGYS